jgi:hypothetical protein
MAMQKIQAGAILAIAMTSLIVIGLAASSLVAYQRVPNSGNVKAVEVGVYWDSACTNNVTSIDWGFLEPGSTVSKTVYVKNNGNTRLMLNMTKDSWSPTSASLYITLSWNREGYVLEPGAYVQTVLTLSVSQSISGVTSFSFNIIITGTERA